MAGALTGAAVPTNGRYMAITRSPLTGMIACSNSGGVWGSRLRIFGATSWGLTRFQRPVP